MSRAMIIDFQLVSKNLPLTLLYGEAAVELYGQQRRHKAARKYAVDVLLTNLFVAFQARRGLKIPMRDSYYRNLPAKKSHFVGFLKLLIKDKLLKWERGAIRADGTREFNTYWPTYDFFRCIELTHRHRSAARRQGLVEAHTIQFERLKSPHCYIVQKDGKNSDPYPNKAEDYKALKASAKLLAKHSFSLFHYDHPAPKLQRIFGEDTETHGRIYPKGFNYQSVRRDHRPFIRIDGEPVTELDFGATIPSIAYLSAGVIPPEDAYSISPFSSFDSHKSYRYIFKKFINIILNTRSIPGAIEACLNALPDIFADLVDEGLPLIDSINSAATVASLIEAFVDHHASIRHLLFKKQGVKLFVTEGDICIEIIRRCTFEGIPVLPIHDSFIVPAKHQSELREIMEQSWGKVTKERFSTPFTHVPRISIKY